MVDNSTSIGVFIVDAKFHNVPSWFLCCGCLRQVHCGAPHHTYVPITATLSCQRLCFPYLFAHNQRSIIYQLTRSRSHALFIHGCLSSAEEGLLPGPRCNKGDMVPCDCPINRHTNLACEAFFFNRPREGISQNARQSIRPIFAPRINIQFAEYLLGAF